MEDRYGKSFLVPSRALAYREKFRRGFCRRLSHAREARCLERALGAVGGAAAGLVADVPCGAGRLAPVLRARARAWLGLDLSPAMLRLAREATGAPALACASALRLPLADRSVDLAVCVRLSHHLPDERRREELLAELGRVSRAAVILSFLDRAAPKQRLHRWQARLLGRPLRRPLWDRAGLARAAAAAGFRVAGWFPLSGLFSGQTLAALVRAGGGA